MMGHVLLAGEYGRDNCVQNKEVADERKGSFSGGDICTQFF